MLLRIELTLPRDARFVGVMREMAACGLAGLEVPDEDVDDVQLALSEACANAVKHAAGASVYQVSLDVDPHECRIEISDQGPGISPDALRPANLEAETGRGFDLMHHLVDDVAVFSADETTTVRMTKSWTQPVDPPVPS